MVDSTCMSRVVHALRLDRHRGALGGHLHRCSKAALIIGRCWYDHNEQVQRRSTPYVIERSIFATVVSMLWPPLYVDSMRLSYIKDPLTISMAWAQIIVLQ